MPMVPSPVAGLTYGAVKVAGYAQKPVPPLKTDTIVFIGALPVRLIVWAIVIDWFYRDGLDRRTKVLAIIYRAFPDAMVMPFC